MGSELIRRDKRIADLEADLAEARAQIAAKDAEIAERFDEATRFLLRAEKAEAQLEHAKAERGELPAQEADPYEAERLQRVTRGIAEIETIRMKHTNINTGEK
jgi:hypothetical protein